MTAPATQQRPVADFYTALRFMIGQEKSPKQKPGDALRAGAGITQIARDEFARRNPTVRNPTPLQIYQDIWKASGAEHLPPALSVVHFDAAVNHGPGVARQLLIASRGDPNAYIDFRHAVYQNLLQQPDNQMNVGWVRKRIPALRTEVARIQGVSRGRSRQYGQSNNATRQRASQAGTGP